MCNQTHGFYMHGNYYTITNNLIYDNLAFGIQVNGSPTAKYTPTAHAGPEYAGASDWIIANNTFAYNVYRAGMVLWSAPKNIRVENNIFYENCVKDPSKCSNVQGFNIGSGARGVSIRNNLFYASGSGAVLSFSTTTGSYTDSGNIVNTLNPNFVNAPASLPSSPNFALKANSPAIDRGLNLSSILSTRTSFNGLMRPRGNSYDIGAYEY